MAWFVLLAITNLKSPSSAQAAENYSWNNVNIQGMGYVTGLVIHPTEANLMYARTDVGGINRWDSVNQKWIPLMGGFTFNSGASINIESIALDPQNANIVYAVSGDDSSGKILKSSNKGQTWQIISINTTVNGNGAWRGGGERLAVDPNNSNILFFGSRTGGLFKSVDSGLTWQTITVPNNGATDVGISYVVFDKNSAVNGITQKIYMGVTGSGIYQSTDAGANWNLISSGMTLTGDKWAFRAEVDSSGNLFSSFSNSNGSYGGVWKFDGANWTNVTPLNNGKGYSGISVNPNNSSQIVAVQFDSTPQSYYASQNGGQTWTQLTTQFTPVSLYPSYFVYPSASFTSSFIWDKHNANTLWLSTGWGVYKASNFDFQKLNFTTKMENFEELVVNTIAKPTGGKLISGVWDVQGFYHNDLNTVPVPAHKMDGENFGITTSIDYSFQNPQTLARVGSGQSTKTWKGGYSDNGGLTWTNFATSPENMYEGSIAVSSADPNTFVWAGKKMEWWPWTGEVYYTRNKGQTWTKSTGFTNNNFLSFLPTNGKSLVADKVNGNTFYLYNCGPDNWASYLYRSTDGGATFSTRSQNQLPCAGLVNLETTPGKEGELWLAVGNGDQTQALKRSENGGTTFISVANTQNVKRIAFGKAAPGRTNPTLFAFGTINNQNGLFRSDDVTGLSGSASTATWTKISDDQNGFSKTLTLAGDFDEYGKVYVGTGGRGIIYGTLGSTQQPLVQANLDANFSTNYNLDCTPNPVISPSTVTCSGVLTGNLIQPTSPDKLQLNLEGGASSDCTFNADKKTFSCVLQTAGISGLTEDGVSKNVQAKIGSGNSTNISSSVTVKLTSTSPSAVVTDCNH